MRRYCCQIRLQSVRVERAGLVGGALTVRAARSWRQVRKTVALICQQVVPSSLSACDRLYYMFLLCSFTCHLFEIYIYEYICISILITAWGFLSLSRFSAYTCKMIYVAKRQRVSFFPISVVCKDKKEKKKRLQARNQSVSRERWLFVRLVGSSLKLKSPQRIRVIFLLFERAQSSTHRSLSPARESGDLLSTQPLRGAVHSLHSVEISGS